MPAPVNRPTDPVPQPEIGRQDEPKKSLDQESNGQRGAFSGALQEAIEKPEGQDFVPYENSEKPEEAAAQEIRPKPEEQIKVSETAEQKEDMESIVVDNEQDAEIVLEAAVEVLKEEENKGTGTVDTAEEKAAEVSDDTDKESAE